MSELQDRIRKGLDELRTLRDTVGEQVTQRLGHASEEAKEAWKRVEPQVRNAEQRAVEAVDGVTHQLTEATETVIADVQKSLASFRDRFLR
jgi:ElaB/YqjD/DUF883 family membrane-anchored ribosome-binding protein